MSTHNFKLWPNLAGSDNTSVFGKFWLLQEAHYEIAKSALLLEAVQDKIS